MKIMVTGATGQQGGAVLAALQGKGHELVALTRNPDSEKAGKLAAHGVQLVKGDFQDRSALTAAFRTIDALFLVGTPYETGPEDETRQGINAVDAAKQAGVGYVVYSSVSDADRKTGIPHFDSKYFVEEHLRQSGVPSAILAPVFFYDNMMAFFVLPGLQKGVLALGMPADVELQGISVKNVGEMHALALQNRDSFQGKRINLAGDSLTGTQYAAEISKASGRKIGYQEVPLETVRESSEDFAAMYDWFTKVGYSADIAGLKRDYRDVAWESFAEWAARQDWSVLDE